MERLLNLGSRDEFLKFLDSLSKINDSGIVSIKPGCISSLVSSTDNTLILHSSIACNTDYETTLNIPDIKKLQRVLETVTDRELVIKLNNNNIEYKGNNVKFKYHLFEEGFLTKPNINLDKINNFSFDITFDVSKQVLQGLLKGSTFASETNKVYFYTENGFLKAELTDRARHNTDSYSITLEEADYTLNPVPINFNNIRLLNCVDKNYTFNINTEYGVVIIDNASTSTKLKYIISSLTQ